MWCDVAFAFGIDDTNMVNAGNKVALQIVIGFWFCQSKRQKLDSDFNRASLIVFHLNLKYWDMAKMPMKK
ncbi:MAG: hypothetical protein WCS73_09695 [Lentisphaeria bacterium]